MAGTLTRFRRSFGDRLPFFRALRFFATRRVPGFERVLLIESGSREITTRLLPWFYEQYDGAAAVDLLTCYGGVPSTFDESRGAVYRVNDYAGASARRQLYAELRQRGYWITGILCSGEPIMTKWKWAIAANVPAKLLIINENCDWFWADRGNLGIMRQLAMIRAGLSGAEAAPALARMLLFPFTLLYLVLYAAAVHTRRGLRHS